MLRWAALLPPGEVALAAAAELQLQLQLHRQVDEADLADDDGQQILFYCEEPAEAASCMETSLCCLPGQPAPAPQHQQQAHQVQPSQVLLLQPAATQAGLGYGYADQIVPERDLLASSAPAQEQQQQQQPGTGQLWQQQQQGAAAAPAYVDYSWLQMQVSDDADIARTGKFFGKARGESRGRRTE